MTYPVFRLLPLVFLLFSACTTKMDAPDYQPVASTTVLLQNNHVGQLNVGHFESNPDRDVNANPVAIHILAIASPYGHSFSEYIETALRLEFRQAGIYSPQSPTIVSGTLQANKIAIAPSFWGLDDDWMASMTVRFVVNRGNQTVFDKIMTKEHHWRSVQLPKFAFPAAIQGYLAMVQFLVQELASDPDFIVATKTSAAALPNAEKASGGSG